MDNQLEKIKALFWRTEFYGAMTSGGVAAMHRGMTNALHQLGHEIVFATSGELLLGDFVKTYHIPYSKFFWNLPEIMTLPYISKSVNSLIKVIEKENPSFLFQHHHDFTIGGTLIKQKTGLPFLLHCDFIQQWTKKHWGKLYFEKLLKWAEEIQWNSADAILTISNVAKKIMIEQYGVNPAKIIVNPNGVDSEIFRPDNDARKLIREKYHISDNYVQGFVGTFGTYHGLEYLAQSIKETISRVPSAIFIFVGDGELRPKVEEIIKTNNVSNKVIFTGLIPYSEVPAYLSACDVLHTPCVNNEDSSEYFGSPTKLFEYMAMQKPIVATKVGQQGDILQHNINAYLVDEKSPEQIAFAIKSLADDSSLANTIANNARQDAIEKWDWKNNVTRIIQTYKSIVNKN